MIRLLFTRSRVRRNGRTNKRSKNRGEKVHYKLSLALDTDGRTSIWTRSIRNRDHRFSERARTQPNDTSNQLYKRPGNNQRRTAMGTWSLWWTRRTRLR